MGQIESKYSSLTVALCVLVSLFTYFCSLPPLTCTALLKKWPPSPGSACDLAFLTEKNLSAPITSCGHDNAHLFSYSSNKASLLYKTDPFPSMESCNSGFLPSPHFWLLDSPQKSAHTHTQIEQSPNLLNYLNIFYPYSLVF